MLCAYCHKEPCVSPFLIGEKCMEALSANPQSFVKERKLPPVNPRKPDLDGRRNRSEREEREQELAASAGEWRASA